MGHGTMSCTFKVQIEWLPTSEQCLPVVGDRTEIEIVRKRGRHGVFRNRR